MLYDELSGAKSSVFALKSSKAADLYQHDIDVMCENTELFRIFLPPPRAPLHHLLIAVRPAEMKRRPAVVRSGPELGGPLMLRFIFQYSTPEKERTNTSGAEPIA